MSNQTTLQNTHSFSVEEALEYGLDSAVLMELIRNSGYSFSGTAISTIRKILEHAPYYKEKKVRRILNELVSQEVLQAEQSLKSDSNMTKFYFLAQK